MAFTPQKTIAQGPAPTLSPSDCNTIDGIPLLPASDSYRCGTKTSNRTLIDTCCDGAEVNAYLGCFMYCSIGAEMDVDRMREMVNCLSSNGTSTTSTNEDSIDDNVFCQGNLSATVQTSAGTTTRRPTLSNFLITALVILFMLVGAAQAQDGCTFSIEAGSEVIKQGEPRSTVGPGTGCGGTQDFCLVSMSGTTEIIGANRTINGEDASSGNYNPFFEVLSQTTTPPRLFPASTSFAIEHWGVGTAGFSSFPYWAPFSVRSQMS